MARTDYASLAVTPEAAEAARRLARLLAAEADRRVTLAEAVRAACQVAETHLAEATAALPREGEQ